MNTVILTGGGTGGHVYPNLALLPELYKRGLSVIYVGGEGDTLERRLAGANNLPYYGLPSIKLIRSVSPSAVLNNLKIPFALQNGIKQAKALLLRLKPDAVFSKGGYVALPLTLAALNMNIPVLCHESDLTVGLANKIAVQRGAKLLTANPHSDSGEFVGMPLRRELFSVTYEEARKRLNIPDKAQLLLVVGGSSGARRINELITKNLTALTSAFIVIHLYGNNSGFTVPVPAVKNYRPLAYSDDIKTLYSAADVVVSRAGATAVQEISSLQKRAIFIPLPKGVSRGDQIFNAELATEYGARTVYESDSLDAEFLEAVRLAIKSPPMRKISDDSNGKIAEKICASIGRGDLCKNKKQ